MNLTFEKKVQSIRSWRRGYLVIAIITIIMAIIATIFSSTGYIRAPFLVILCVFSLCLWLAAKVELKQQLRRIRQLRHPRGEGDGLSSGLLLITSLTIIISFIHPSFEVTYWLICMVALIAVFIFLWIKTSASLLVDIYSEEIHLSGATKSKKVTMRWIVPFGENKEEWRQKFLDMLEPKEEPAMKQEEESIKTTQPLIVV